MATHDIRQEAAGMKQTVENETREMDTHLFQIGYYVSNWSFLQKIRPMDGCQIRRTNDSTFDLLMNKS